ncbi:MAG: histidine phosphatase family protein, partial [Pseudomonadota bacterium]
QRSAKAIGDWLRAGGYAIDQALVSTATRTRETFDALGLECDVNYLDRLYHAGAHDMRAALATATGDTILMLGHNPGIAWFAHDLVAKPPDHPRFDDYPTCATLVARFDIAQWQDLRPGQGQVEAFVIPRELLGE